MGGVLSDDPNCLPQEKSYGIGTMGVQELHGNRAKFMGQSVTVAGFR